MAISRSRTVCRARGNVSLPSSSNFPATNQLGSRGLCPSISSPIPIGVASEACVVCIAGGETVGRRSPKSSEPTGDDREARLRPSSLLAGECKEALQRTELAGGNGEECVLESRFGLTLCHGLTSGLRAGCRCKSGLEFELGPGTGLELGLCARPGSATWQ